MKKKVNRLQAIKEIIINTRVGSQEELLQLLSANGYNLTQATLSRDLKQLKIAKVPGNDGGYVYVLPEVARLRKNNACKNDFSAYLFRRRIHFHKFFGESRSNKNASRIRGRHCIRHRFQRKRHYTGNHRR